MADNLRLTRFRLPWASALTAAAFYFSGAQVFSGHCFGDSADAAAHPHGSLIGSVAVIQDAKKPKCLTAHVNSVSRWRQDRGFNGLWKFPAEFESSAHEFLRHIEFAAPLGYALPSSLVGDATIRAAIKGLPLARGPLAVVRFVIPVVVDSLDSRAFRSRPHVGQEVLERLPPPIADADTPSAVAVKMSLLGIVTSLNHSDPRFVRGFIRHAVRRHGIELQAPAATVLAAFQVATAHDLLFAAVALTEPRDLLAEAIFPFHYEQTTKTLSDERNECWHNEYPPMPIV